MLILSLLVLFATTAVAGGSDHDRREPNQSFRPVQKVPDLSGLAWIGGDTFLAVHDAKFPEERRNVRVSLLRVPDDDGQQFQWKPLRPRFPGRPSNDLESAARIPGTRKVLLVESGDGGSSKDRIWLARANKHDVKVTDFVEWSSFYPSYENVEGTAVVATDSGYLFVWGERNEGSSDRTLISWTDLTLRPFQIGTSGVQKNVTLILPPSISSTYNRPLVGMDISDAGDVYTVAAYDPNDDSGPYSSAVLNIGMFVDDGLVIDVDDEGALKGYADPTVVGVLDGFKTESIAIRSDGEDVEIFAGTDDENYGGTLRPLRVLPDDSVAQ